jgi:hypothetical protein
MAKTPHHLISFPPFEEEGYGLDFKRMLFGSFPFALVFSTLIHYEPETRSSIMQQIHLQHILNFILQAFSLSEDRAFPPSSDPIVGINFRILFEQLEDISFNQFTHQNIKFGACPATTLYDFLDSVSRKCTLCC